MGEKPRELTSEELNQGIEDEFEDLRSRVFLLELDLKNCQKDLQDSREVEKGLDTIIEDKQADIEELEAEVEGLRERLIGIRKLAEGDK